MVTPAHTFPRAEHEGRLARLQAAIAAAGDDALIAVMPETVTWTTGFFTRGYASFQLAIVPASGAPTIVCRDVSDYYIDATSAFPDRVLWSDSEVPEAVAAAAIASRLGPAPRLAVEMGAWPLSAARYEALRAGLPGARWRDAGRLATDLRLIKSPAEIALQRRAARAAEAGMQAACDTIAAGISERELAAAICAAMVRAGSDMPGPGVLSSGERTLHLHGGYCDRVLAKGDTVQVETTPNVRNYHARFMRPFRVAEASDADHRTVATLIALQDAALAEVRPGVPATLPDRILREGVLAAGLRASYTNKTFYSIGLLLPPSGGEPLEAHPAAAWAFAEGMTFHSYVLARGFGMSETIAVTATGCERLTTFPRQLFVPAR